MIKEVLRLYYGCCLNQAQISKALGCARSTVQEYLKRANAAGVSWPVPEDLDDVQLECKLYKNDQSKYAHHRPQPDCQYIHNELKKKGVTVTQLWIEYKEAHPNGYGLSRFCWIYRQFDRSLAIAMRQEHKGGDKAFSDFAGTTLPIVDPKTGEVKKAHLFVCTLGASNYTFAKLYQSEDTQAWCDGHAEAFSYFDGCPQVIVPDNPKPVITKASPYEPDINPNFAQMANHYGIAVIPARVRRPKDKAKVEAAVGIATRWILAVLRNRTFFSIASANKAVAELLENLNSRPFKKLPGSRRSLYEQVDKGELKPLPQIPYQYRQIKNATVHIDYHIEFDGHYYSVPFQHRGLAVEVQATAQTVEIFFAGRRVAGHLRSYERGRATTVPEHRPKNHAQYADWSPERLINWAKKIGPCTSDLVHAVMSKRQYPELGYRSCLGILRLAKVVGNERLEAACHRALAYNAISLKSIKSILDTGLDRRPLPEQPRQLSIVHPNIRGAASFTTTDQQEVHNVDSTNTA
jgi:transposase